MLRCTNGPALPRFWQWVILGGFLWSGLSGPANAREGVREPVSSIHVQQRDLPSGLTASHTGLTCVTMRDGRVLIGDGFFEDSTGSHVGRAYACSWDGSSWTLTQVIDAPETAAFPCYFAAHAAASDDRRVLFLHGEGDGSALEEYEFVDGTWTHASTILSPEQERGGHYGFEGPVALDGDVCVATSDPFSYGVAIYRDNGTSWALASHVAWDSSPFDERFGNAIDVSVGESATWLAIASPVIGYPDFHGATLGLYRIEGTSWTLHGEYTTECDAYMVSSYDAISPRVRFLETSEGARLFWGTPWHFDGNRQTGGVQVFRCDGSSWTLTSTIVPSDRVYQGQFGCSLDVKQTSSSGLVALVGARRSYDPLILSGAAYVFREEDGAWVEKAKIAQPDGFFYSTFGSRVALDEICGTVQAIVYSDGLSSLGHWYAFSLDFSQSQQPHDPVDTEPKATASDGGESDHFGYAVAIDGDTALVASPGDDAFGHDAGSVYAYRYSGDDWVFDEKIPPPAPTEGEGFGSVLLFDGARALIGADRMHKDRDTFHVYSTDGADWTHEQSLQADQLPHIDGFGVGADIHGERLAVLARCNPSTGTSHDVALVYRLQEGVWQLEQQVAAPDSGGSNWFSSVAIRSTSQGWFLVAGNDSASAGGANGCGSVHFFRYDGASWQWEAVRYPIGVNYADLGEHVTLGETPEGDPICLAYCKSTQLGLGLMAFVRRNGVWVREYVIDEEIVDGPAELTSSLWKQLRLASTPQGCVGLYGDATYDANGAWSGAAWLFSRRDGKWAVQEMILPTHGRQGDTFGNGVALCAAGSGVRMLIGAPGGDERYVNMGEAYFYEADPTAFEFPTHVPSTQKCRVESDGAFWLGVYCFTDQVFSDSISGSGVTDVEYLCPLGQWVGQYLYDIDTASYTEARHIYREPLGGE